MCGLCGVAGTIDGKEEESFKDLLVFNTIRGSDSVGVAEVGRHKTETAWFKMLGPGTEIKYHKKFDALMSGYHKLLMGHNRSATIGNVTLSNAHPFKFTHVTGMHNGTLDTFAKSRLPDSHSFGTDSEAIINAIDTIGPEETFSKLEGSWTVVWHDQTDGSINFVRNEKRPLIYIFSKDRKTLFFGSEPDLLVGSMRRMDRAIEFDKVMLLPANSWHKWIIPGHGMEFGEATRTKMEPYKAPAVVFSSNHNYQQTHFGKHQGTAYKAGTTASDGWPKGTRYDAPDHQATLGLPPPSDKDKVGTVPANFTKVVATMDHKVQVNLTPSGSTGTNSNTATRDFSTYICWRYGTVRRVYRDTVTNIWISLTKMGEGWNEVHTKTPPADTPFTRLHQGAHEFHHIGKKKKKKIFFEGYNRHLIDQSEFEEAMSGGCVGCGRVPEWGHKVHFLDQVLNFLCEHCGLDGPQLKLLTGIEGKEKKG